ncbi:hypothetical protein K474DRAFT_1406512 [Panus rudis PR-1116 ss-1]|nr:hypothetical protein K474DRAFT_1406512 [Panus rudis PR-1116 ss-1]
MRLSTVYAIAAASAAAPAVLAAPLHAPSAPREVHAVAPRLYLDESGALDTASVHSLLQRALYHNEKRGPKSSQGGSSSNSLLNRIGGPAPAARQPAQAPVPPPAPAANAQMLGNHVVGPNRLGPNPDGSHPVFVQMSGNTLAGQPARQQPTLHQVGDHIRQQSNAATLRRVGTTDVTIHQADHYSGSDGGQTHASFNAYDQNKNLVHTGHAPGPLNPPNTSAQRNWGTMKPATGGQADTVVNIGHQNTLPDPPRRS